MALKLGVLRETKARTTGGLVDIHGVMLAAHCLKALVLGGLTTGTSGAFGGAKHFIVR